MPSYLSAPLLPAFNAQQPFPGPPASAAAPAKPKVRAQMGDDLKFAQSRPPAEAKPLTMPSPEQLGIGVPKATVDWNLLHQRFHDAGATCFQLDQRPNAGCKLTCLLPTAQPDRTRHIEVEAATESEVARLALEQLAEWRQAK